MFKVQYTYDYRNVDFWDNLSEDEAIELVTAAKRCQAIAQAKGEYSKFSWNLWYNYNPDCAQTLAVRDAATAQVAGEVYEF